MASNWVNAQLPNAVWYSNLPTSRKQPFVPPSKRLVYQAPSASKHNRAMQTLSATNWSTRIVTLLLAGMVAGSAVFWLLKWSATTSPMRTPIDVTGVLNSDSTRIARLLGVQPSGPLETSTPLAQATYKLMGVISVGRQGQGSALISAQAKPAKPYRVGDEVSSGLVLQAVSARTVSLGSDLNTPPSITLELPLLAGQP